MFSKETIQFIRDYVESVSQIPIKDIVTKIAETDFSDEQTREACANDFSEMIEFSSELASIQDVVEDLYAAKKKNKKELHTLCKALKLDTEFLEEE